MEKKLVAVLCKKLTPGVALNAVAHMALGLSGLIAKRGEIESLRLDDYQDANGNHHLSVSDYPFIILKAGTGQIRNLAIFAEKQEIPCVHFLKTMTIGTYEEQKEETLKLQESEIEFLGICMFGDRKAINELTKKFSLWK
jgi:hypothetical protein